MGTASLQSCAGRRTSRLWYTFFFSSRRRHTRFDCDWSSDVCSSDLGWFAQAAASGDLVAAFNLGLCLARGVGVGRDEQQAVQWLRRAAEGVPEAQLMYEIGRASGRGRV